MLQITIPTKQGPQRVLEVRGFDRFLFGHDVSEQCEQKDAGESDEELAERQSLKRDR